MVPPVGLRYLQDYFLFPVFHIPFQKVPAACIAGKKFEWWKYECFIRPGMFITWNTIVFGRPDTGDFWIGESAHLLKQ